MRIASRCCSAVESPGRVGQSMFATVATQAARNSRGNGGGSSAAEARPAVDPPITAAASPAVRTALDIQAIRMILSRRSALAPWGVATRYPPWGRP